MIEFKSVREKNTYIKENKEMLFNIINEAKSLEEIYEYLFDNIHIIDKYIKPEPFILDKVKAEIRNSLNISSSGYTLRELEQLIPNVSKGSLYTYSRGRLNQSIRILNEINNIVPMEIYNDKIEIEIESDDIIAKDTLFQNISNTVGLINNHNDKLIKDLSLLFKEFSSIYSSKIKNKYLSFSTGTIPLEKENDSYITKNIGGDYILINKDYILSISLTMNLANIVLLKGIIKGE